MKRLKQLSTTTIICLMILVVFLEEFILLAVIFPMVSKRYRDKEMGEYYILRSNAESNPYGNETDYFYYSDGMINRYSFETGETTTYHINSSEKKYMDESFVLVGDCVYYVMSGTVRRLNYRTGEDERVLSAEDIVKMYSGKGASGCGGIILRKYEDLLVMVLVTDMDNYIYVCSVKKNMETDFIDVNTLFPAENRTGEEEEIVYEGICIRRYYDIGTEYYKIVDIREEKSGCTIFSDRSSIKVDGKLVSIWREDVGESFLYCVEGDSKEHEIDCLMSAEYDYSWIQSTKMTVENGEVIGLMHVVKDMVYRSYYPLQEDLRYDILFRLDPGTGESSILYRTKDSYTRIIGYQDGVVYLLKNHKVYSQTIGSWRKTLLFELPNYFHYVFDWQGDYLVVKCGEWSYKKGYESFEAYKIE